MTNYTEISDELEYLNRVSKEHGADMTVIFSDYAPAAAATFVTDNLTVCIISSSMDCVSS